MNFYSLFRSGYARGEMVKAIDYWIISLASSNSSRSIMFTFGQIPLGKVRGAFNKFLDFFFRMGTFIDSTHMKL